MGSSRRFGRPAVSDLPLALRLLAHPTLGAQGISDEERRVLLDAARRIEAHDTEIEAVRETVRDLSVQCDQLRASAA